MRGPRGEAMLFGTANPQNKADGAGSVRPEGKNALKKRDGERSGAFSWMGQAKDVNGEAVGR
jgi:hypothetical protein